MSTYFTRGLLKVFDAYKAVVVHVLMAVLVHAKKCSVLKLSPGRVSGQIRWGYSSCLGTLPEKVFFAQNCEIL